MMDDKVLEGFLEKQFAEGMALARQSDMIDLIPLEGRPPTRYVLQIHGKGIVRETDGRIHEANHFEVGIWFPEDYLRSVDTFKVLTWLGPQNAFHPNVSGKGRAVCLGTLNPGTPLTDLCFGLYELVGYHKHIIMMDERKAVDRDACAWARRNIDRFPIEDRPLKRRPLELQVKERSS